MSGLQVESIAAPGRVALEVESAGPDVESVYVPGPRGLGSGGGSGDGGYYRWRVATEEDFVPIMATLTADDVGGVVWVDQYEMAFMFAEYPLGPNSFILVHKPQVYRWSISSQLGLPSLISSLSEKDIGGLLWIEDIATAFILTEYPATAGSFKSVAPVIESSAAGVGESGPYLVLNYVNGGSFTIDLSAAIVAFDPLVRAEGLVEFRHDGGSSSDGGFGTATSGGGYGYTPNGGETSAAYGGVTTSTSASGRAAQRTGNTSFNSSIGPLYYMHQQAFFTALSDGANSYISYSGFTDSSTGDEPSNGAYFEYNKAESDYWQCVTAAGGLRTKTVTSVLAKVLADGADKLQIKIEGGVAKFWINENLVHTEAGYIPSGWSQPFGAMSTIRKTSGTSARIFAWDMLYARQILATPRDLSEPDFG
jgi:hypothetical protein